MMELNRLLEEHIEVPRSMSLPKKKGIKRSRKEGGGKK
jgi:hypothetical protein